MLGQWFMISWIAQSYQQQSFLTQTPEKHLELQTETASPTKHVISESNSKWWLRSQSCAACDCGSDVKHEWRLNILHIHRSEHHGKGKLIHAPKNIIIIRADQT